MKLSDYGLTRESNWAAFVFARVSKNPPEGALPGEAVKDTQNHIPLGYIFVIDPAFGERAVWKLPAGHAKEVDLLADDPPRATAIREFEGETGIPVPAQSFRFERKWFKPGRGDHPDHWKILFSANITEADRDWMHDHHEENEGEKPKYFSINDFHGIVRERKFMRPHLEMLQETGLILFAEMAGKSA